MIFPEAALARIFVPELRGRYVWRFLPLSDAGLALALRLRAGGQGAVPHPHPDDVKLSGCRVLSYRLIFNHFQVLLKVGRKGMDPEKPRIEGERLCVVKRVAGG